MPAVTTVLALAAFSFVARPALAQTSSAQCSYAEWTYNTKGENACNVWAQLQDICVDGATVGNLTSATAPYPAPTGSRATPCNCNLVAYNLMAGCSWCQPGIYTGDWVTFSQWVAGCSSVNRNGLDTNIEQQVSSGGISIPTWARRALLFADWSPSYAEEWATASASLTPGVTSATSGSSATANGTTSTRSTNQPSWATLTGPFSGGPDDFDDDNGKSSTGVALGVALGIVLGLPLLGSIIAFIVFMLRQNKRKKFYGPLASYYASGGAPPDGLPTAGSGMAASPMVYAAQTGVDPKTQQYYVPSSESNGTMPSSVTPVPQSPPQAYVYPDSPQHGYAVPDTVATSPSQSYPTSMPNLTGTSPPAQYLAYSSQHPYSTGAPMPQPPPGAYNASPHAPAGVPLV